MSKDIDRLDMTVIINKPNWVIRWGITVFWGIAIIICVCCYLVK